MSHTDPHIIKTCSKKLATKLDSINPSSKDASDLLQSLMVLNSKSSSTR